jgi:gamma-glutamyltranspeptidase / glutathione hydrolase
LPLFNYQFPISNCHFIIRSFRGLRCVPDCLFCCFCPRFSLPSPSPEAPRNPTSILQVILNVIDFGLNVQDAVDFPRFHHQWLPDQLYIEKAISPDTAALLQRRGYRLDQSPTIGASVNAIVIDDGWLQGATDGRTWTGRAAGY